jgi:hypothetical protein
VKDFNAGNSDVMNGCISVGNSKPGSFNRFLGSAAAPKTITLFSDIHL